MFAQRFEHKTADKNSARKIDTPIRFPASLCMAPYTTLALEDLEKAANGVFPGPVGMIPSTLGACLDSLAYMCFYVKRHLDYKVEMRPTYVIARETEALREKEKEKENEEKEAARMKEVEDALLATV
ncbi:hypothetical protein C0993_012045 [Termitomyces sp. T159_Od127]|nr:hypothetical protein C0993_012045 [Termitomyces sp. T159_Od127]